MTRSEGNSEAQTQLQEANIANDRPVTRVGDATELPSVSVRDELTDVRR